MTQLQLPAELVDAMRVVALQVAQSYAAPWAVTDELRRLVMAQQCRLTAAERDDLAGVVLALAELRPGTWATSREIIALALAAPGPTGDALRKVCSRFLARPAPAIALGKFLSRCIGMPVGGLFLERVEAQHRRDSAMYRAAGMDR